MVLDSELWQVIVVIPALTMGLPRSRRPVVISTRAASGTGATVGFSSWVSSWSRPWPVCSVVARRR